MATEIDDEGYEIVNPKSNSLSSLGVKGRKCGACGMKFEFNKTYSFHCGNYNCPCGWNK